MTQSHSLLRSSRLTFTSMGEIWGASCNPLKGSGASESISYIHMSSDGETQLKLYSHYPNTKSRVEES